MINNIILASKSGVRKKILNQNGINCEVMPANVDEDMVKESLLKEKIFNELEKSKKLFKKYNWPIIDVTRKSVEETAASIIKILDILNSRWW